MRLAFALLAVSVTVLPAYAQRDIQQPKGTWQQPKDFQVPKGPWQEPGNIQIPKGINAVRTTTKKTAKSCERRLSVVGDALFDFNKPDLRPDAEETLSAAVPEITRLGGRPNRIEGPHRFDRHRRLQPEALGSARRTVRDWLAKQKRDPGVDADPRLRQVDADRAEHDGGRQGRSGRPPAQPPCRGGVRGLRVGGSRSYRDGC